MASSRIWDVVVIGAGGAGLAAARHAREGGADVLAIRKGLVGRTGSAITSGGISVAGSTLARMASRRDDSDTGAPFHGGHDPLRPLPLRPVAGAVDGRGHRRRPQRRRGSDRLRHPLRNDMRIDPARASLQLRDTVVELSLVRRNRIA